MLVKIHIFLVGKWPAKYTAVNVTLEGENEEHLSAIEK